MIRQRKKYRVITKVPKKNCPDQFLKFHVSNLLKYQKFLDREFSEWTWTNVYCNDSKKQLFSFTTKNRL